MAQNPDGERLSTRDRAMWDDYVLRNMTQAAIAAKHGVSQQTVSDRLKAVRESLGEEHRDAVVQRRLAQLNAVMESLVTSALNGDKDDVATLLKVMEREAKYLGLDAPARREISGRIATYRVEGVDLDALR